VIKQPQPRPPVVVDLPRQPKLPPIVDLPRQPKLPSVVDLPRQPKLPQVLPQRGHGPAVVGRLPDRGPSEQFGSRLPLRSHPFVGRSGGGTQPNATHVGPRFGTPSGLVRRGHSSGAQSSFAGRSMVY